MPLIEVQGLRLVRQVTISARQSQREAGSLASAKINRTFTISVRFISSATSFDSGEYGVDGWKMMPLLSK
jgi:hypothetical protein